MRIERAEHPVNRAANEHFVLDRIDVAGFDPLIGSEQSREFRRSAALHLREPRRGGGQQGNGGAQGSCADRGGEFHVKRILFRMSRRRVYRMTGLNAR